MVSFETQFLILMMSILFIYFIAYTFGVIVSNFGIWDLHIDLGKQEEQYTHTHNLRQRLGIRKPTFSPQSFPLMTLRMKEEYPTDTRHMYFGVNPLCGLF